MLKLGTTSNLGVALAAAAFQAAVQRNDSAVNDVKHAFGFLNQLIQNGVNIDPFRQISTRLQTMIDNNNAPGNIIESIRDDNLINAYQNLRVPVLLNAYLFGRAIGGAESWTNVDSIPGVDILKIIQDDATSAATIGDALSSGTPLRVPLDTSDIPNALRTIPMLAAQNRTTDVRYPLVFLRGKSQGILDVTGPENF